MWDQRYQLSEYAYGESPNVILLHISNDLKKMLIFYCQLMEKAAMGFFLLHKFKVTTFDQSVVGCKKAELLAKNLMLI